MTGGTSVVTGGVCGDGRGSAVTGGVSGDWRSSALRRRGLW